MQTKELSTADMQQIETKITTGVSNIIEKSKQKVAVYLNSKTAMTYWRIGKYVAEELATLGNERYGAKIVATVSQQLTARYGKGYTKDAIFRMVKVANAFPDEKKVGTLSRQLTWSHFIELTEVLEPTKRLFYQQMTIVNHWSVRQLRAQEDAMAYERSLIASKNEEASFGQKKE